MEQLLDNDVREYFTSLHVKLATPFEDDDGLRFIFVFVFLFVFLFSFVFFVFFFHLPQFLTSFLTEKEAFVNNVFKEAKGSEVLLCLDTKCSLSIDRLLLLSNPEQVCSSIFILFVLSIYPFFSFFFFFFFFFRLLNLPKVLKEASSGNLSLSLSSKYLKP